MFGRLFTGGLMFGGLFPCFPSDAVPSPWPAAKLCSPSLIADSTNFPPKKKHVRLVTGTLANWCFYLAIFIRTVCYFCQNTSRKVSIYKGTSNELLNEWITISAQNFIQWQRTSRLSQTRLITNLKKRIPLVGGIVVNWCFSWSDLIN